MPKIVTPTEVAPKTPEVKPAAKTSDILPAKRDIPHGLQNAGKAPPKPNYEKDGWPASR